MLAVTLTEFVNVFYIPFTKHKDKAVVPGLSELVLAETVLPDMI